MPKEHNTCYSILMCIGIQSRLNNEIRKAYFPITLALYLLSNLYICIIKRKILCRDCPQSNWISPLVRHELSEELRIEYNQDSFIKRLTSFKKFYEENYHWFYPKECKSKLL